jgi:hypothetical protein
VSTPIKHQTSLIYWIGHRYRSKRTLDTTAEIQVPDLVWAVGLLATIVGCAQLNCWIERYRERLERLKEVKPVAD